MSRIRPFIGGELIKVMTGIRRSGKSVMLELIKEELMEKSISFLTRFRKSGIGKSVSIPSASRLTAISISPVQMQSCFPVSWQLILAGIMWSLITFRNMWFLWMSLTETDKIPANIQIGIFHSVCFLAIL